MSLLNRVSIGCFMVSLLLLQGQALHAASLQEAIISVLDENPEINAQRAGTAATHAGEGEAWSGYLPKLSARVTAGREHTESPTTRASTGLARTLDPYEMSLTVSQMIYDGGAVGSLVDSSQAMGLASSMDLLNASENMALKTAEVYLDVLRYRDLIDVSQNNLQALQHLHDLIKKRVEQKVGRQSEMNETQARLQSAEAMLMQVQGGLESSEANYRAVVGSDPEENLPKPVLVPVEAGSVESYAVEGDAAEGTKEKKTDAEVLAAALKKNPTLMASRARVQQAEADLSGKKAAFLPKLSLELKASNDFELSGSPGTTGGESAKMVMSYDLFAGGGDTWRTRAARHLLRQAHYNLERDQRNLEVQLKLAQTAYETAKGRHETFIAQVAENRQVREAYQQQFTAGKRTLLDLLEAENQLFLSQTNQVTEQYQEQAAEYRLLALKGVLLDRLQVQPPSEAVHEKMGVVDVLGGMF